MVIDSVCPEESTSPDLHYSFVQFILENYKNLIVAFDNHGPSLNYEILGCRDDMKLLYNLCKAYIFYKKKGYFPKNDFPNTIPSLHCTRWNSRAIMHF